MAKSNYTDQQRINALEKHLWFVEPQYHDGGFRVGKATQNGTLQHKGRTLRAAIDKALRAEGIATAGVQPCRLCARGFPVQDGYHYGTQSLGMIAIERCSAIGGVQPARTRAKSVKLKCQFDGSETAHGVEGKRNG